MSQTNVSQGPLKKPPMTANTTDNISTAYSRLARHLPDHPYILSVPDFDLPRKRPHELALEEARWIRDSPFAPDEAHLQYMTLVLRDTADSCYELRTQVDEEREYRMREIQKNGNVVADAGAATPKFGPAKKKISLAAYKEKKGKPPVTEQNPSAERDTPLSSTERDTRHISGQRVNGQSDKQPAHDPIIESVKNTIIDMDDGLSNHTNTLKRKSPVSTHQPAPSGAPPLKKMRPEAPATHDKQQERFDKDRSSTKLHRDHGLPPMLSPGRQSLPSSPEPHVPTVAATTSSNPHGLPPMLSPTLPPDLERAWRDSRKDRARANSDVSSQSALSESRSSKFVTPSKPEKTASSDPASITSRAKEPLIEKSQNVLGTSLKHPESPDALDKKQKTLLVKLRYSKRVRKQIASILKGESKCSPPVLGPAFDEQTTNKSHNPHSDAPTERDTKPSASDREITGISKSVADVAKDSRKRLSDTTLPEKPHKKLRPSALPNGLSDPSRSKIATDPPVTPIQDEFEPRKQNLITPKNHSGASATTLSRVSTPHNLTPLPPARASTTDRVPKANNTTGAIRPGTRTSQLSEYSKLLNKAGRDLKHGAQALSTAKLDPASRQKQQAIMMLESNMAYIMAYSFQDEVNRSRGLPESWETTWQTIFPFLDAVASYTKHYPDLEAVRCYLAYAAAHRAKSNMLAYMVASISSPPETTPGASGAEHHLSPPEPNQQVHIPHNDPSLPGKIASFYKKARTYIAEASSKLPPDDIAKRYPKTWSAREQRVPHDPNAFKKEREVMITLAATNKPGGHILRGPFWLPITEAVTPIQAVRFGVTICAEWAKLEGVKHEVALAKAG